MSTCGMFDETGHDIPVAEMAEWVAFWRHECRKARDAQTPCTL